MKLWQRHRPKVVLREPPKPERTQGEVQQGARRTLWQRHRDDEATPLASS